MDDPLIANVSRTEPSQQKLPWTWRLRAFLLLTFPQNERAKIKKLLNLGDEWCRAEYFEDADALYEKAAELARKARVFHLQKKARERRTSLQEELSSFDQDSRGARHSL